MATQYTSYWLYQKYEKRGSQEAIPVYPNVYSVDADGTMSKVIKIENDSACGYVPTGTTQYRWVNLDPSVDYYCDECPPAPQYRWVESGTTCVGYDKYQRAIKQVSYDSGATWSNVEPAEYSATTLIEANSTDCGYVPPTPTGTKLYATYSDGRTYSAACDSSTDLTGVETKPSGYKASAMTSAVVGDCVTVIDYAVFSSYRALTSVTIPNSVTTIGNWAFAWCSGLTRLNSNVDGVFNIPDSVTDIGSNCFNSCASLTSITFGNSLLRIGAQSFVGCSGLTSVMIPDNVVKIYDIAFANCTGLTSVTIGSGIAEIGGAAFADCTNLTSITVNATTPPTLYYDTTAKQYPFDNTNNCPIYVPSASVSAYKSAENWSTYADRIRAIP